MQDLSGYRLALLGNFNPSFHVRKVKVIVCIVEVSLQSMRGRNPLAFLKGLLLKVFLVGVQVRLELLLKLLSVYAFTRANTHP